MTEHFSSFITSEYTKWFWFFCYQKDFPCSGRFMPKRFLNPWISTINEIMKLDAPIHYTPCGRILIMVNSRKCPIAKLVWLLVRLDLFWLDCKSVVNDLMMFNIPQNSCCWISYEHLMFGLSPFQIITMWHYQVDIKFML